MSEATASLSDQINAIWSEMEYGYYGDMYKNMIQGMDENIATMVQESLSAISLNTDSNDLEQVIKDTVARLNSAFETNSGIIDLYYQWKEADTQGDARDARSQLKKELVSAFGDSYDETEEKILLSLGFRVETDSEGNQYLIDEYDYYMRTLDELNRAFLPNITSAEFNSLSESEAKKAFELFKSGAISASIAYEDLLNLVRNETPDTLTGMVQALKDQLALIDDANFANSVTGFLTNSKNGSIDNIQQYVNETFSYLPEYIRNLMIQLGTEVQEGGTTMGDAFGEVMDSMKDEAQNMADTVRQEAWTSLFPDLEGEIEGQVDSFGELYKVMNSVAESYEMLKNAQEEQKETGRVSGETFMSMLNENPEYIKAFNIDEETGKITLAADALEQFNQIRLASVKAAIAEMIATEETKNARIREQMAMIEQQLYGKVLTEQAPKEIDSVEAKTAAYLQLAKALTSVNLAYAGDTEAAQELLSQDWSEFMQDIEAPEIDYSTWTDEELNEEQTN